MECISMITFTFQTQVLPCRTLKPTSHIQDSAPTMHRQCTTRVMLLKISLCHSHMNYTVRPCSIHTYMTVLQLCSHHVAMGHSVTSQGHSLTQHSTVLYV
jgi:branched-subunit amino acid transport protein AzlD